MARLAGFISLIGTAIAFVIVVGIALVVLDANASNGIVDAWLDVARWLTQPFHGLFDLARGEEDLQAAINWGIAAVVYAVVAAIIARLLARLGTPSLTRRRAVTD